MNQGCDEPAGEGAYVGYSVAVPLADSRPVKVDDKARVWYCPDCGVPTEFGGIHFCYHSRKETTMPKDTTPPGLTEGRIVHYVLADGPSAGQHRPAIVVRNWGQKLEDGTTSNPTGCVQLQVFTDGPNDQMANTTHASSVVYSEEPAPNTWYYPERA